MALQIAVSALASLLNQLLIQATTAANEGDANCYPVSNSVTYKYATDKYMLPKGMLMVATYYNEHAPWA